MQKLYHVSTIPNLKKLTPHVSSHRKAYVYASPYLEFCLLIGSKKSHGDFDGMYGVRDGVVFFIEAYTNAFKDRFQDECCYVYEVDPTSFQSGKTSFGGEVVSEEEVEILSCQKIENVYARLQDAIRDGKLILEEYSLDPVYQQKIRAHIKSRLLSSDVINHPEWPIFDFCKQKYADIIEEIRNTKKSK